MPKPLTVFSSVQFNRSFASDSLQPHELQHTRPSCPSPTPVLPILMSIELGMPSNQLILCCPLLLLPSIFPNLEPVCCSMSSSNCFFLTCIFSGGRYGCLVFPSLSEFSTACCDSHKVFGLVNKAEVDVFLECSCFFDDPTDVGNLISGSSAFSKSSLNIWNFTVYKLLKTGLDNFDHYFVNV